ncbi:hypothetical protein P5X52_13100, partial [Kocuria palustris]|nr:hypothetical protein [Kocuria palustris]
MNTRIRTVLAALTITPVIGLTVITPATADDSIDLPIDPGTTTKPSDPVDSGQIDPGLEEPEPEASVEEPAPEPEAPAEDPAPEPEAPAEQPAPEPEVPEAPAEEPEAPVEQPAPAPEPEAPAAQPAPAPQPAAPVEQPAP